ncbi:UNVERIFIED_CONTAM: hypothetical protein Scaly_2863100 [Sesamum calycinum]|uniref:DUF4283 domain-containing protein n=1 Tax=Sesamum calycinum TaxID=2727403 RepID=A0AAW2LGR0_9LAMI
MRVFKWSPTFTPDQESSIIPIWVSFSELPAHLFHKDAIFLIASIVGTPLQMADSTYNQSKLSRARVCIEIDLLKPLLEEFDIQIQDRKIIQKIEYEKIPHYCSLCRHVGHQDLECYTKGDATNPPPPPANELKERKSAVVNEHKQQPKMQGKKVTQAACKVIDERPVRKEPTVVERGECSKTAEERHRYDSADLHDSDNYFLTTAENEIVNSPNYAVNTENESCRKGGEIVGVGIANAENDVVVHPTRIEKRICLLLLFTCDAIDRKWKINCMLHMRKNLTICYWIVLLMLKLVEAMLKKLLNYNNETELFYW